MTLYLTGHRYHFTPARIVKPANDNTTAAERARAFHELFPTEGGHG